MKPAVTTALVLVLCLTAAGQAHTFTLAKGTKWTYKGTVRWTVAGAKPAQKPIQWTVEVVDHATRGDAEAALLRGWPADLAWYEEGSTTRGDYALVRERQSYFLFVDRAQEEFQKFQSDPRYQPSPERIFFREPLKVDARFCEPDQEQRTDMSYCWWVDGRSRKRVAARGVPPGLMDVFTLMFRTNPEHELIDIHPGLGITHYEYHHHGTVSDVDLDLSAYSAGEK